MTTENSTIPYNPKFVSLGLGVPGALFLSQALLWSQSSDDGWFTKTRSEWEEETGLSPYQQRYAREKLLKLDILKEEQKGMPRRIYFHIDQDVLRKSIGN